MNRRYQTLLPLTAFSGLTLIVSSAALHAQTAWDGGGGNTDYSNNLNWATDIIPGNGNANGSLIGNSSTQTVIYNTATSYTSTGTGKANSLLVGTGTAGNGSLTLSGSAGTLTFGGDGYNNAAWIGSTIGNSNATGNVTVSAGKLAITGGTDASINLGVLISGTPGGIKNGTLLINGGTVEVGRRLLMAANADSAIGVLTLSSGTLDMKRTGSNAEGDLGMIRFGTGTNTVNLDGGTAILTGFHISGATNARSNIYFNGTTLKANVANTDFFSGTTANANLVLKNGGLVFDTNTFNVTINDALTQQAGQVAILRKEGTGTLTISGAQTRTGTTTVNGGTLLVTTTGTLGTGATTVSGSGSILNLDRNDTWGTHSASVQALTIQSGGLVTNGTQINRGFNAVQTLSLDGGELRVTGTARAVVDGALFKFEAYAIRDTVTVTGTTASSITNPTAITNAGINIGGFTDLGGGVGSALTFNVADVTSSSAADLTVSAVLKNNYDSIAFNPLSNGLTKTGGGTMVLSAVNTYTGATTITTGTLQVDGSTAAGSTVGIGTAGTLSGSGTVNGNATLTGSGIINKSAGTIAGTLAVTGGNWNGAGTVTGAVTSSSGTFTIASGANLTATAGVSATGGALVVNGTLTGTLVANTSTTISGTGTITGNATIQGIQNPGNSPGIQTFGANLAYSGGASVVNWELVGNTTTGRGTNFDGINVGATLDFSNPTTLNLAFNFAGSTVDWQNAFWDNSYTGTNGWLVYSGATGLNNFSNLSLASSNWADGSSQSFNDYLAGSTFGMFQDGNNIYLTYTAVPEPRAALLGGIGLLAMLRRHRYQS